MENNIKRTPASTLLIHPPKGPNGQPEIFACYAAHGGGRGARGHIVVKIGIMEGLQTNRGQVTSQKL